ncbi:hypothetical protein SmJEL517_g01315 [Synchytrium microbalum]|uniref:FMP27 GFWDK domain-containing protein n=1 Tax=Synchytrium microbalum TaxID=1806994 RepID=A0A507CAH7_9FUNG|nr:uncharacterized protein SmJEL517_g01315 [Synchytrium microbalum]TPX36491.1 hypothetical protein SmJEL517_g01315 [Synchytrium microbalum]
MSESPSTWILVLSLAILLILLLYLTLVGLLRRNYGISFRSIGFCSLAGLTRSAVSDGASWDIELIATKIHTRSHTAPSWITLCIQKPHIRINLADLQHDLASSKPKKKRKSQNPWWLNEGILRLIVQTGLKWLFTVFDVVVEGCVVSVILDDEGSLELKWCQDKISIGRLYSATLAAGNGDGAVPLTIEDTILLQVNAVLTGCQIYACLGEPNRWTPVLLNSDSTASVVLRNGDDYPLKASVKQAAGEELLININIGSTSLDTSPLVRLQSKREESLGSWQRLQELDMALNGSSGLKITTNPLPIPNSHPATNKQPPPVINEPLPAWLANPARLANQIRRLAIFRPTISLSTRQFVIETLVSLPIGRREAFKILSSLEHIRAEVGLGLVQDQRDGRSSLTCSAEFLVEKMVSDVSDLENTSPGTRSLIRLMDIAEIKVDAGLETYLGTSVLVGSMATRRSPSVLAESSASLSVSIIKPHIILDDQIVAILETVAESPVSLSAMPFSTPPQVPSDISEDIGTSPLCNADIMKQKMQAILQLLTDVMPWDVRLNALVASPSVAVRLSAYNPSHRSNEDALLTLDVGDLTFGSRIQAQPAPYAALSDGPVSNVDIHASASIDGISVEAVNLDANTVLPTPERRPDRLIHLQRIEGEVNGSLSIGESLEQSRLVMTALVKLSRIDCDMAPIVSSAFLDYFSLAVALSTSIRIVTRAFQKLPTSQHSPSTSKPTRSISQIPHELQMGFELTKVDVVLVSEGASPCATFGLLEDVALQVKFESNPVQATSSIGGHVKRIQAWTSNSYSTQEFETLAAMTQSNISSYRSGNDLHIVFDLAELVGSFSLRRYYIVVVSAAYLMKMVDVLSIRRMKPKNVLPSKSKPSIEVNVGKVSVACDLPDRVLLDLQCRKTACIISDGKNMSVSIENTIVSAPTPHSDTFENLVVVDSFSLIMRKESTKGAVLTMALTASEILLINPYGYELSGIIENGINLSKALMFLHQNLLGFQPRPRPSTGHTTISQHEIPTLTIDVKSLVVKLCDSPFEMHLSRTFTLGLDEQSARLARHAAFEKRIMAKLAHERDEHGDDSILEFGNSRSQEVRRAWGLLQEFNSKSWIESLKKSESDPRYLRPLVTITLLNLHLKAEYPTLPCQTIEKSINALDSETPDHFKYFELIPREVTLGTQYASLEFRDHLLPFVAVPGQRPLDSASTEPCLVAKGLVIIAERLPSYESRREVKLSLDPLRLDPLIIERFVNPPKIYLDVTVNINTPQISRICWGTAMEPALGDMVRVFDTIFRQSVDPSPPSGWWDKVRLMFHGRLKVKMYGGGLVFRMLASRSPYYDPSAHFGSYGMDIGLRGAVAASMNDSDDPNENILIESEELTVAFPGLLYDERGETDAQKRLKAVDLVVLKLCGGVKLSCGLRFMTSASTSRRGSGTASSPREDNGLVIEEEFYRAIQRRHVDVVGRVPEYAKPDFYGHEYDSFAGFRSTAIHLTVSLESPRPFYSSLVEQSNSFCLTSSALDHFMALIRMYSNPLGQIPIHRGSVFSQGVPERRRSEKLSRVLKSIHLKAQMRPILMSFVTPGNEGTAPVGVRTLSKEITGEIFFRHDRVFRLDPVAKVIRGDGMALSEDVGETDYSIQRISWSWAIDATRIELAQVEGRMIEFSKTATVLSESNLQQSPTQSTSSEHSQDDNWLVDGDPHPSSLVMIPFMWSPRFAYYRTSKKPEALPESLIRSPVDVFSTQINLCHARLREIEGYIRRLLEIQRMLEQRMAVFFDDSLRQESQAIVEKLAILYEKKTVIDEYIQRCERQRESINDHGQGTQKTESVAEAKQSPFDHHFIIHNISVLWRKDVRNAWFKLLDLHGSHSTVRYCMSNAAMRIAQDIIATSSQIKANDLSATHNIPSNLSRLPSPTSKGPEGPVEANESQIVDDLLTRLVAEQDVNFLAQNEYNADTVDAQPDTETSALHRLALPDQPEYVASNNPESPDFVHSSLWIESKYIIQFINAQVNMESDSSTSDGGGNKCVLVAADIMQLQSVSILASSRDHSDPNVYLEDLVTSRLVFSIHNAQFLVAQRTEFAKSVATSTDDLSDVMSGAWPLWLPVECMIDLSSPTGDFKRVIDRTSAFLHRDKSNPLFLKRTEKSADMKQLMKDDLIRIRFPDFIIDVNSAQYLVFHDVIEHLLVYREPSTKDRREKLRKMLLAFEQMEDFRKVAEIVVDRQTKVRQAESLMKYGTATYGRVVTTDSVTFQHTDLVKYLSQNKDDLVIVLDAMTKFRDLSRRRLQGSVAWQMHFTVGNMVWLMEDDVGDPLCRWMLKNAVFRWVHNEDLSSSNTLEIDRLVIENLSNTSSVFKELLGPYIPDKRIVDFKRQKMLRVFWREMAPVAGIKVVDHFELNLFPLSFQITYDVGKKILRYIFPKPTAPAAATISEVVPLDKKLEMPATRRNRTGSLMAGVDVSEERAALIAKGRAAQTAVIAADSRNPVKKMRNVSSRESRTYSSGGFTNSATSASLQLTPMDNLRQMQTRATENRTFIYIKLPESQHCLSYRGSKEKNLEDLTNFVFRMPSLEYRNKTWTWLDFINQVKKDSIRAVWANAPSLVREKLFARAIAESESTHNSDSVGVPLSTSSTQSSISTSSAATGSDITAISAIGNAPDDHGSIHESSTSSSSTIGTRRFRPFTIGRWGKHETDHSNEEMDDGATKARLLFGKTRQYT